MRAVDKGLPLTFVIWLRDFLSNRQARVQINGEQGLSVPLKQGLPQGSVLSPLLFLLYINDLKTVVPNCVEVTMFADKISLFCSHPCKFTAQIAIEEAVTRVTEWSRHHKMTFNTENCELAFFTRCTMPDGSQQSTSKASHNGFPHCQSPWGWNSITHYPLCTILRA